MAKIQQNLRPFGLPNFAVVETGPRPKQEGVVEPPRFHLSDLEPQTLSELCDEFRAGVFEKAGKKDPRAIGNTRGESNE